MFFNDGCGKKTRRPAPLGYGGVKPRADSDELILQVGFPKVSRWTQVFGVRGSAEIAPEPPRALVWSPFVALNNFMRF